MLRRLQQVSTGTRAKFRIGGTRAYERHLQGRRRERLNPNAALSTQQTGILPSTQPNTATTVGNDVGSSLIPFTTQHANDEATASGMHPYQRDGKTEATMESSSATPVASISTSLATSADCSSDSPIPRVPASHSEAGTVDSDDGEARDDIEQAAKTLVELGRGAFANVEPKEDGPSHVRKL